MIGQAYAVEIPKIGLPGEETAEASPDIDWVVTELSDLIEVLIVAVVLAGVIALTFVGIMFMTSQGNEEKTKKAIKYAIVIGVGLALALSAVTIIQIIDTIPNGLINDLN